MSNIVTVRGHIWVYTTSLGMGEQLLLTRETFGALAGGAGPYISFKLHTYM